MIKEFENIDRFGIQKNKRLYMLSRSSENPLKFEYSYSIYYKLGPPPDMINELGFVDEKCVKNLLRDIKEYSKYVPTYHHPSDLSAPVSDDYIVVMYHYLESSKDKILQYSGNIEKEITRFNLIFDKISKMKILNNND